MTSTETEVQRVISVIRTQHAHPELAPPLYRLLAAGEPVSVERLAAEVGWNAADLQEEFARDSGIEWDEDGRIVGFGMTLRPTPHTFTFDGRTVYASCADAGFEIPIILGRPGVLESPCAATGRRIRIEVTPTGVVSVDPPEAVVSKVSPTVAVADVRAEICGLGNFISSPEDGAPWLERYPQGHLDPVADGFEIVRRVLTELGLAAETTSNQLAPYTDVDHCDLEVTAMTNNPTKPTIAEITELVRSATEYGPDVSRLMVRLARMVAQGDPVTDKEVADVIDELGIDKAKAVEHLTAYAERDDRGNVIGAVPGVTLRPTPHRFTTDTAQLWTWCVPDTVVLPIVLNQEARVETTSPNSKEIIRYTATPRGVFDIEPAGAVLSFPLRLSDASPTDGGGLVDDLEQVTALQQLLEAFCHHGHAFGSLADAQRHFEGRDDIAFVPLSEAFDVLRGESDNLLAYK